MPRIVDPNTTPSGARGERRRDVRKNICRLLREGPRQAVEEVVERDGVVFSVHFVGERLGNIILERLDRPFVPHIRDAVLRVQESVRVEVAQRD